ncbi:hypothetical protein D0T49_00285 [Paludibacter sp. 221]|uniref:hypothetical protein n=1 Tax=Paludibacter sp. 221 TaxID=2302939 RepID=UPI0013D0942D|nr:hypothetical protein [Paludibacter sp. 221]NDV45490.1 hypothetical protein [Paludibacter sp. 221]
MQGTIEKRRESRRMNVLKRAEIIQSIVAENFEPGNQSKSRAQAYRQHINKLYPMGERTFWRYMSINVKEEMHEAQKGQLAIDFN